MYRFVSFHDKRILKPHSTILHNGMPNLHGGKAYKKGKKPTGGAAGEATTGGRFEEAPEGTMYARVTRMLGNRRTNCFCNDGVERVCKIRGALCKGPKRQKIEVGDIVVVSLREFADATSSESETDSDIEEATAGGGGRKGPGDILDKVPTQHYRHIKKLAGIHKNLFPDAVSADGLDDLFAPPTEEAVDSDVDVDAI